jgi:hypothetical protein
MNGLHEVARKLIGAFRELGKLGVIARHNFLCCQSCGVAELNRLMIEKIVWGEEVKGAVFYHAQDNDHFFWQGGDLMIRYLEAVDDDDVRISALSVKELGDLVCEVLSRYGLALEWNGSPASAIRVLVNEERASSRVLQ